MKIKTMKIKTMKIALLALFSGALLTNSLALAGDQTIVASNTQVKVDVDQTLSDLKASDNGFMNVYLLGGSTLENSDFSNTTFNSTQMLIFANYREADSSSTGNPALIENVDFSGSTASIYSDLYSRTAFAFGYDKSTDGYMHSYINNVDFSDMNITSYTGLNDGYTALVISYNSTLENSSFNGLTFTSTSASASLAYGFWLSSVMISNTDFRDMTISLDENADEKYNIGISGNSSNWTSLSDVDFRGTTFDGELMNLDDFVLGIKGSKAELNNVILGDGTIYSAGEFEWSYDSASNTYLDSNNNVMDLTTLNVGIILNDTEDSLTIRQATDDDMASVTLTVDSTISAGELIFEENTSIVIAENVTLSFSEDCQVKITLEEYATEESDSFLDSLIGGSGSIIIGGTESGLSDYPVTWEIDISDIFELEEGASIVLSGVESEEEALELLGSYIYGADGEQLNVILTNDNNYNIIAVPEPSTYAMIFGALALGLAIYRRRK